MGLSICGFDGVIEPFPTSVADAVDKTRVQHDERLAMRVVRFADAPLGSLVWTRDGDGLFWLGRLIGPWRYDGSAEAAAVGLTHVRQCRWLPDPIPEMAVPVGVLAAFARGGRNWQRIHALGALDATDQMWREATG